MSDDPTPPHAEGPSHGAGTGPRAVSQTDPDPDSDLFGGSPLRNTATALRRVLGYDAERYGVQPTSIILLARNIADDLVDIIDEIEREESEDARQARIALEDVSRNGTVGWESIKADLGLAPPPVSGWLASNPASLAMVREGLDQAKRGELVEGPDLEVDRLTRLVSELKEGLYTILDFAGNKFAEDGVTKRLQAIMNHADRLIASIDMEGEEWGSGGDDEGPPLGGDPSLGDAMIEGMREVNERLESQSAVSPGPASVAGGTKPLSLSVDPEWLLRMAEKEGNGIFSVGGLVTEISRAEAPCGGSGAGEPPPAPASVPRCLGGVKHGEGSFGVPIPMTPEEAQAAYDAASPVPLSDARIAEIVRYATGDSGGEPST